MPRRAASGAGDASLLRMGEKLGSNLERLFEGVEVRPFVPDFWPPEFTHLDAAGGEAGFNLAAGEKS